MGIDKVEIDKVRINKVGIDEVGINLLHQLYISWSSVMSCVNTKQQSYNEQQ